MPIVQKIAGRLKAGGMSVDMSKWIDLERYLEGKIDGHWFGYVTWGNVMDFSDFSFNSYMNGGIIS